MGTPGILEEEFKLKWRLGARSGFLICETASRFRSSVRIEHGGLRADAKKAMQVMMLGPQRDKLPDGSYNFGPDAGALIKVCVAGADAVEALAELRELFTCGETVVQCRNTDCISSAILLTYGPGRIWYSCSNVHVWSVERSSGRVVLPRDLAPR